MKNRLSLVAGAFMTALMAVSCSPQMFNMPIDMRHASASGLDLGGKTFSLVYVDNGFKADSCLSHGLAEGFAISLEKEYFGREKCIDIYKIQEQEGADYSNKDTLVNLVLDCQSDVVFLLDTPDFKNISVSGGVDSGIASIDSAMKVTAFLDIEQSIYVYDSMCRKDTVFTKVCRQTLSQPLFLPQDYDQKTLLSKLAVSLESEGIRAGGEMTGTFRPVWKTEECDIIYYDSNEWIEAVQAAVEFRWKEAMSKWLHIVTSTRNMDKRSCASYNMALACYMQGDYKLALEWLDSSDKDCPISLSEDLRKRIRARMK